MKLYKAVMNDSKDNYVCGFIVEAENSKQARHIAGYKCFLINAKGRLSVRLEKNAI